MLIKLTNLSPSHMTASLILSKMILPASTILVTTPNFFSSVMSSVTRPAIARMTIATGFLFITALKTVVAAVAMPFATAIAFNATL